ncbi:TonB-dependent receptor [Skermanella pratensis]|uniref:TonB-dependent receptor n=1 Tax=Skermanella pratensis TaxID=2233999 RepID=UPI00130115FA|nr:TonB-dependent siderophore receptor [Skermanella pratensis]
MSIRHTGLCRFAPSLALTTALTVSASAALAPAAAQEPSAESESQVETLAPITVTGPETRNTMERQPSLDRLPTSVQDTPQGISVVPRELIEERNITSLREAVRNVPGISINAGEGGAQGDTLTIRGFSARGDLFVDGARDPGQYNRDTFNLQSVEVLKGPSSLLFGRGSTGGVINLVTKTPTMERSNNAEISLGNGPFFRGTADLNMPVGPTAAVRLNVMGQDSDTVGRDLVEQKRWGIAPSIGLGLGTDTRFTLSYLHQEEDNIPDYGLPYVFGRPAPVDIDTFYGLRDDFEDVQVDLVTAKLDHVATDWLKLSNTLRAGYYSRDATTTAPRVNAAAGTPIPAIRVVRSRPSLESDTWTVNNNATATATFDTGPIGHTLVAGVELGYEDVETRRFGFTGLPTAALFDPDPNAGVGTPRNLTSDTSANASTFGVYAADRIALTDQWSIIAGLRWDRFSAESDESVAGVSLDRTDTMWSTRAAVVYEPTDAQTYYFSYGTSFNPSAEFASLSAAQVGLEPEENRTFEVGAKFSLLGGNLGLGGSLFRIEKTNARTVDPIDASVTVLQGEQRVDGFELEANGRLTDRWTVLAGYTYLDGEITKANDATLGKALQNTPEHSGFAWTTYEVLEGLEIGAGAYYTGDRYANNTNTVEVPDHWRFDALMSYTINDVRLALNAYNLFDEEIYDGIYQGHVIPAAGRTLVLSAGARF